MAIDDAVVEKEWPSGTLGQHLSALYDHYGPQNWWPAQSRFEVITGAYLTQNTSWRNVELAIKNLRQARVLHVRGMRALSIRKLEQLIRPSGYFRQKARRLKFFIRFLDNFYGGSLDRMFRQPTTKLRGELLALEGVGPETADSILLYAGGHPVFVVDAYTRRIFEQRHRAIADAGTVDYEQLRSTIEKAVYLNLLPNWNPETAVKNSRHLPSRVSLARRSDAARIFNELHAVIVRTGNDHCRTLAKCDGCPLQRFLS